uniref:TSA: Wollemia nobilis Ref_Wollemi_Transcript_5507_1432 transcribed RNA sequence n=1 Tax=Wollemia nobilis TaxID=56998 RepID=A0A0C9S873_9CONI
MWRRAACRVETLAIAVLKKRAPPSGSGGQCCNRPLSCSSSSFVHSAAAAPFSRTPALFAEHDAEKSLKKEKTVEDIMPIATGLEREDLEYELQGKKRFELDPPSGYFGTKEEPAIVESYFDKRIVGCPGGADDEEHDVVWFWLEKDKPFECPVCSQYFQLKVIGPGGPPGGHHH